MTTAKRLLLGTAAAFVATSGAHAADLGLPVAPAVDYVQICTIGSFTGFILPGSDVCFDISGFVRWEMNIHPEANSNWIGNDDIDQSFEAAVNFDARTMTEWGLLRGFIGLGEANQAEDLPITIEKAFVQIGGLTAGLTDSFFDPVYTDFAMAPIGSPDGGTDDLTLIGYTFAFGNGFTLMASVENNDGNGRFAGILGGGGQDIENGFAGVLAARVDQAWGSAKIAGAVVQVDENGTNAIDSELGWAIQGSANINIPVGVDSNFGFFGIYSDGAISYAGAGGINLNNGGVLFDISYDAVVAGTNLVTTQAWALGAGFEIGLNAMTDFEFDGYYADVDHGAGGNIVGDYSIWAVRGSVAYRPVSGLELRAGVGYTGYDFNNAAIIAAGLAPAGGIPDDEISARFRITRSF